MKKGFTLIELLVVVAIIGMLSSVVLSSLNTARGNSRDAKRLQDGRQIATALELRYNTTRSYPSSGGTNVSSALTVLATEGYIPSLPIDPLYGAAGDLPYLYCAYGTVFEIVVWKESLGSYCHIRHGANDPASGCWMSNGVPSSGTVWCDG